MKGPGRIGGTLWTVVGMLAVLRMAALLLAVPPAAPLAGDEPIYDRVARHLLAGDGYVNKDGPWVWKPPGWPVTLAGIYAVAGDERRTVAFFQGIFDTGTALLGGWVAMRLFGTVFAGLAGYVALLFWPPFLSESRYLQTEPLFTFLLMAALAIFLSFTRRPRVTAALALGVVTALAALVRPTGLIPVAGLLLGWFLLRRADAWSARGHLVHVALGLVLTLAPWTIRNAVVFGGFVPISTGSGEHFYMGSTPETDGRWDPERWVQLRGGVVAAEERRLGHRLDPLELDRALLHAGLENWRHDPLGSIELTVRRFGRLVFLPFDARHQPWLRAGFLIVLVAVYGLALVAGFRRDSGPRGARGTARVMLFALLMYASISSLVYARSRYFEPVRPLALILAAGVVAASIERRVAGTPFRFLTVPRQA